MKYPRTLLLAVFALCAMTAFAVQYPTSPSAGQAQQPATQMPQTQTPQSTMPPAQSPQSTNPSAPAPQTSDQQGQAGAQQQPGRPSIDDQVKTLTTTLNLSSDQQTKMRSILENQHQQAMTIVNNNSLSRDDKIAQVHALRQSTIQQARGILNDDQRKKLDSMLQENEQHMHPQGQQGQQTPGTTTPGTTTPPSSTNPPSSTTPPSSNTPPKR